MFYSLKDKLRRFRFNHACQQIFHTAPVEAGTDKPIAVLTQLQHKDVMMFLVAIKTFTLQIPIKKVYIINDGSLSADDLILLEKQIPIAEVHDAKTFSHPNCPKGGTWERLFAISSFIDQYYIIQLDSDTLTIGPLEEVKNNIETDTGFAIGTWENQTIESMLTCSTRVQNNVSPTADAHVQMLAEASFSKIEGVERMSYVRACSGFAGFPRQSFNQQFIIDFSNKIELLIGSKWHDWGSEQVMSNVVVANLKQSSVLPLPKYCDCLHLETGISQFIHFIGDCRFNKGLYGNMAKQQIEKYKQEKNSARQ